MGGFYGGVAAGAVVVVILGVGLSVTTPLADKPTVANLSSAPEMIEPSDPVKPVDQDGADADLVEVPPTAPETPQAEQDVPVDFTEVETATDGLPRVDGDTPVLDAPDTAVEGIVPVAPEGLASTPDPVQIPEAPGSDALPVVLDETPQPSEPDQIAVVVPEFGSEIDDGLPEVIAEEEIENPFENSPIAVEGDEDTAPRDLPRIAALPQIGGEQLPTVSSIAGKRVVPLTDRDTPEAEPEAAAEPIDLTPIESYAASFENPESKPLMSIILIDDEGAFGAEALQDFPYPLSFAVNPSDPEAAEKMARHRAAGFEVLALADLPQAASAQDAEVSLSVWLDTLPETVGILEGVETGIQGNRKLADQVAAIAAGTGRGLITQDNGLNTVQKLAARNGVPSGVVFRDIDGARQDPKIMRRFLDQAAFRAGQEGTVVMLGRLRPETISALLLWGLEDRGNRVAMAPISAVMMKEVQ